MTGRCGHKHQLCGGHKSILERDTACSTGARIRAIVALDPGPPSRLHRAKAPLRDHPEAPAVCRAQPWAADRGSLQLVLAGRLYEYEDKGAESTGTLQRVGCPRGADATNAQCSRSRVWRLSAGQGSLSLSSCSARRRPRAGHSCSSRPDRRGNSSLQPPVAVPVVQLASNA